MSKKRKIQKWLYKNNNLMLVTVGLIGQTIIAAIGVIFFSKYSTVNISTQIVWWIFWFIFWCSKEERLYKIYYNLDIRGKL